MTRPLRPPRTNSQREVEMWRESLRQVIEGDYMPLVVPATAGNIPELNGDGSLKDSGVQAGDVVLDVTGTAGSVIVSPGPDQTVIISLDSYILGAANKARQYYFSGF